MPTPSTSRRSPGSLFVCLLVLGLLTWIDLRTKDWALEQLSRPQPVAAGPVCIANEQGYVYPQRLGQPPLVLIDGFLELRYAENCGAAFGVLNHGPSWLRLALFGPAAIAAALGLIWLYWRGYGGVLFAVGVPLIASGALGNLVDRFRFGYVVDFIRFHIRNAFVWPTFNVADITITVGVILLVLEGFIAPRDSKAAPATARDREGVASGADSAR